ncbi:MAG: hypothetical protein EOO10_23410 [Chitinophagaceae bacterium]|nr:MAG: hypothetical protein EOO10_23410 [Chitinophagaceae bacterium]
MQKRSDIFPNSRPSLIAKTSPATGWTLFLNMIDIKNPNVSIFLDAVDSVLNSNTFLLQTTVSADPGTIESKIETLLKGDGEAQLFRQDEERDWHFLNVFDVETMTYERREGVLVKPNLRVEVLCEVSDPHRYMVGMLTADPNIGNFKTFYGTQKSKQEAEEIVAGFLTELTKSKPFQTFVLQPDFLYNKTDKVSELYYFEGGNACDTATCFLCYDTCYLLLTNGID